MAAPPMFSCRRCSLVVPGIGTIHGFCASSQPSAICAEVACLAAAIDPSRSTKPLVCPARFGCEARHDVAKVVFGEGPALRVRR